MSSTSENPNNALDAPSLWQRSVTIWSVALILSIGTLALVWLLASPLALFFLSIIIAAAFSPIVDFLEKWLPRLAAILLVYGALIAILIGMVLIALPTIVEQGVILSEQLPDLLDDASSWIEENELFGQNLGESVFEQASAFSSSIITLPVMLFSASIDIFIIFIISIYLLIDAKRIREFGASLFPPGQREHVLDVAEEMLTAAGGYVRGVSINIVLIGIITSVGLMIIGVDFAIFLGVFAGFMEIFPLVGPLIGSIPILLIALLQSPTTALITLAFILIVQFFEGNVLIPNIMQQEANVPPYVVMFALLAGGAVGGVLGAVTAIPLAAVLRVFILRVIVPEIKKQTYPSTENTQS